MLGATLLWGGRGIVRTASSFGVEPEVKSPVVVRCCLEPIEIAPLPCTSAFLVEAETGTVLYDQNADDPHGPASLVKMMLQLLVYEDLASGRLHLSDRVRVSKNAATMGGSQVFLRVGETRSLSDLLDAIAIASANDASMAVAEHVAGSEAAFVERMNAKAERLGCTQTHFVNVHGLDLRNQGRNVTSARDLATIARALVRYPRALQVSSTKRKPFGGDGFQLESTDKLLGRFEGLDGLKTGWTPRAGGCFVATAQRDGVRLIAVILAARPGRARFRVAERLLEAGYARRPHWIDVLREGEPLGGGAASADPGPKESQAAAAGGTVRLLLEEGRAQEVSSRLRTTPSAGASPDSDAAAGLWVDLRLDGRTIATVPARVARGG
ncbi:MAG: D-alanyl-D-alanine carboxypeptidase family protein [bacterium]